MDIFNPTSGEIIKVPSPDFSGYLKLDQTIPQTTVGTFVFPGIATDFIVNTLGTPAISIANSELYSGSSTSMSWGLRKAYDSNGIDSWNWENRQLFDSSFNQTIDYQNKQLLSGGSTTVDWGNASLSYGGVVTIGWGGLTLSNTLGHVKYNWDYNLLYANNGVQHAVIDIGQQVLYDIADQSSIRWSSRDMYASDGSTVVANYTNTTGMRLFGSVGTGFSSGSFIPSARIHAHSLSNIATYQKTTNTITGALSTDGFDVGVSATGVAEIRQRENLAMEFYTNNTLCATLSNAGNLAIGTISPSARLHIISTTEQFRAGYDASIYWNATTAVTTGITTFNAVGGTTPKFVFSDNVELTQTVTTESVTSDRTVTIVINGTSYKLLAKA